MIADVKHWCQECRRCQVAKGAQPMAHSFMGHFLVSWPNEVLAIEFTVLETTHTGLENILVMMDIFSKYTLAAPTRDQCVCTVAQFLMVEWFCKFGVPSHLHLDQGQSFESALIRQLCDLYGIARSQTTLYHLAGNGQCEWFTRTMLRGKVGAESPNNAPNAGPSKEYTLPKEPEVNSEYLWLPVPEVSQAPCRSQPTCSGDLASFQWLPSNDQYVRGPAAITQAPVNQNVRPCDLSSVPQVQYPTPIGEVVLRRTGWATAGQRSNIHHLPRTVGRGKDRAAGSLRTESWAVSALCRPWSKSFYFACHWDDNAKVRSTCNQVILPLTYF